MPWKKGKLMFYEYMLYASVQPCSFLACFLVDG